MRGSSLAGDAPAATAAADSTAPPAEVDGRRRVVVEGLAPRVDGGAFPAKRSLGERIEIEADVFTDGHDLVAARLLYRGPRAAGDGEPDTEWSAAPMLPLGNDRFRAELPVDRIGRWTFTVEGWIDHFASWRRDLEKRRAADQTSDVDLQVGAGLVAAASSRAAGNDGRALAQLANDLQRGALGGRVALALDAQLLQLMTRWPDRSRATRAEPLLLDVDPELARCSAWYELFPRSTSPQPGRHGTFRDVVARLPYVEAMGFDVLYLPPIHPIGAMHRKGRNNARTSAADDVGSPWAIGAAAGGHDAIHPELGTLAEFRELVDEARRRGIRIALDLALQCSPDHPWVHEHPEWFRHRPDGTIQHAENPPKKYEDIVPFDFECAAWRELWTALHAVVEHWIGHGVEIFRVDNPHTKAFPFWEWLIGVVRARHPQVFFLAEAFTRPKVMYRLAKIGFSQSYNYFPWRTTKRELTDYFTELTRPPLVDFFRANLWPNTPDILTEQLQHGARPAFAQRLILAATLGASYGIYGPPFELMEAEPREAGSEEYRDSEKYELRHWPLREGALEADGRDSLAELIARVNKIRRENPALQHDRGLRFHPVDSDALVCYSKLSPDRENAIVVVVNLDPANRHGGWIELDSEGLGLDPGRSFQVHDLLTDQRLLWSSGRNYVDLDPWSVPAAIFRLRRKVRSEVDFDYFL